MVYVDDYPIGLSPVSASFTYYGTRRIRLLKDGYEPLTIMEPMWPPWYDIPPLDMVTENLLPGELRDQRDFCYQLKPQAVVPPEQLLARGEQLRRSQPVSALAVPPAQQIPRLPPTTPQAAPGLGAPAVPGGVVPLQPIPESVPAPQGVPVPQEVVPAPVGVPATQPEIGGQLPHPLPPP